MPYLILNTGRKATTSSYKRSRQLLQASRQILLTDRQTEALKHSLSGMWSRRINQEYRIVYKVEGDIITVYSLRFHCAK